MSNIMKKITLITLLILSGQSFGFITVGLGGIGVCDHNNLLDAFIEAKANNDHFIRVTSEMTLHDTFIINDFIQITGGYDSCADADTNTLGTNLTQWSGDNTDTVVTIDVSGVLPLVLLENFRVFNGRNIGASGAGGISIVNGSVTLLNSVVESNAGREGGGIRVRGISSLTIQDSSIGSNSATSLGGGIFCFGQDASVTMKGDSVIKLNSSTNKGGGIYAAIDCSISINNGAPNINPVFGINGNLADFGGGVYLSTGADMIISGNDLQPAEISDNLSLNNNAQFAGGGGVFLTGAGTTLTATNTEISGNTAVNYGAGMVVEDFAQITMKRLNTPCWDNDKCSRLWKNRITSNTGYAAVGYLDSGAVAKINQTYISENEANSKLVFYVKNAAFLRMEGNIVAYNIGVSLATTQSLFEISGPLNSGGNIDFLYNTLTHNNASTMFKLNATNSQPTLRIMNSMINDQGLILETAGANTPIVTMHSNYVHENASLIGTLTFNHLIANPSLYADFVDGNNGDFHIANNSQARDYCGESIIQSQYKDLNGKDRGVDDLTIPNLQGTYEPGAYEYQSALPENIFSNGFE